MLERLNVFLNMYFRKNQTLYLILIIGIILRMYYAFIFPTYNVDEIALGLDIKNRSLIDILKPMDDYQSAPPLYLIIQKLILHLPFKSLLTGKLLSFFISTGVLYLSFDIAIKKIKKTISKIIFVVFFSFSPFILYHTLTLKQYGMDLFFLLFVFRFFNVINKNRRKGAIILSIWCLVSNIGLFFSAGFIIRKFIDFISSNRNNFRVIKFIKVNWVYSVGGICYVFYFIWFLHQPGGEETKIFMQNYWKNSFVPLDSNLLRYLAYFVHGLSVSFFSSYHILGYTLFVFYLFILWSLRGFIFKSDQAHFLIYGFFIHLLMNVLNLYPLSDRLYLYLSIFMILPISVFLDNNRSFLKNWIFILTCLVFITWTKYIPYRENDVLNLSRNLDKYDGRSIFFTTRAYRDFFLWQKFTDMDPSKKIKILSNAHYNKILKDEIIVSRVHHKFGHEEKTSKEENFIVKLQMQKKIELIHKVDGYNLYKVMFDIKNIYL